MLQIICADSWIVERRAYHKHYVLLMLNSAGSQTNPLPYAMVVWESFPMYQSLNLNLRAS